MVQVGEISPVSGEKPTEERICGPCIVSCRIDSAVPRCYKCSLQSCDTTEAWSPHLPNSEIGVQLAASRCFHIVIKLPDAGSTRLMKAYLSIPPRGQ